jgi:hypothetical protein
MLRLVAVRTAEDSHKIVIYDVPESECDYDGFSKLVDDFLKMRESGKWVEIEDIMIERGINYDIPDAELHLRGFQLII